LPSVLAATDAGEGEGDVDEAGAGVALEDVGMAAILAVDGIVRGETAGVGTSSACPSLGAIGEALTCAARHMARKRARWVVWGLVNLMLPEERMVAMSVSVSIDLR
jgi:hypothetical protein